MTTYGVNYPASYDFLAAADGATDATNRISALAASCPSTRIVLGGYSQGAAVVDMLAGIPPLGNKIGEVGSAPPLPSSLVPNVAAVAVFGNPATKFGNPVTSVRLRRQGDRPLQGRRSDLFSRPEPVRPQRLRERRPDRSGGKFRRWHCLASTRRYHSLCH